MLAEIMWCNLVAITDIAVNPIRFVFATEIYSAALRIFLLPGLDAGFNELSETKFFFA